MSVYELHDKTYVLYFIQVMRNVKTVFILTYSVTQTPDTFSFISSDSIGMHSRRCHTGFQKCNSDLPATIENIMSTLHMRFCYAAYGKEVTIFLEPWWHT